MNSDDAKELATIRGWKAEMERREAAIAARAGSPDIGETKGPVAAIVTAHLEEDVRTTLYDRMTSAELMQLYDSDREEWQRVMDAKQSAGMRKLFGRG